jgi:hypothetical protein
LQDSRPFFTPQEWEDQCNLVMNADLGINILGFENFLVFLENKYGMLLQSSLGEPNTWPSLGEDKMQQIKSWTERLSEPENEGGRNSQGKSRLFLFNLLVIADNMTQIKQLKWL